MLLKHFVSSSLAHKEFPFVLHRIVDAPLFVRKFDMLHEDVPARQLDERLAVFQLRLHSPQCQVPQETLNTPVEEQTEQIYSGVQMLENIELFFFTETQNVSKLLRWLKNK